MEDSYWTVTRVKLKPDPTGTRYPGETPHGKAWGTLTWAGTRCRCRRRAQLRAGWPLLISPLLLVAGESDGKEQKLRGVYKRVWRYIPET